MSVVRAHARKRGDMADFHYKEEKDIKVIMDADVLVAGGGLGGICAALASANAGMTTVLIEKNAVLGGQAAEIDTWGLDGFVNREGHLVVAGYPWKLLWEAVKEGGSDPLFDRISMETMKNKGIQAALEQAEVPEYVPYIHTGTFMNPFNDQYVNPNAYRYAAMKALEEAGVQVLLGMPVTDAIIENRQVKGVIVQGEFEKFACLAKRTVDTTQGASVCALAGPRFLHSKAYLGTLPRVSGIDVSALIRYIRETDENWLLRPMVGENADADKMERLAAGGNPLAIHGFMKALERAIQDNPEYGLLKRMGSSLMFFYERDGIGAYWIIDDELNQTDVADPVEFSVAICTARKQQWLMHRFFTTYIPGFEHAHLLDTYASISKAYHQDWDPSDFTEYTITKEEIQGGFCRSEDVIIKLLGHPMSGQNANGWYMPLQSMIPKELEGILVTGKPACRKLHYIASCGLAGQAAGAAAAVSIKEGKLFRETCAAQIREVLRGQGVLI